MRIAIPSAYLSREHARLSKEEAGWVLEDLGSHNGVFVNGAQIARTTINPGDVIAVGRVFFTLAYHEIPESWTEDPWLGDRDIEINDLEQLGCVSLVPTFERRLDVLKRDAGRTRPTTLVGATGTGKELLARALHRLSGRLGPYVALNCGAVPRDLVQSELFGHVRGAFTGAPGSPGYVRAADRGTLLLDEVVEAPSEVQLALLRVLQEKAVVPVGQAHAHPVDVKVIAAAQRPLDDAVAAGTLRPDLRARLQSLVFALPPLRERMEDFGLLVAHGLRSLGVVPADAPRLAPHVVLRMLLHDWPLNIRELVLALERAWAAAEDGLLDGPELPAMPLLRADGRNDLQVQLVMHLRNTRGNVAEVARRMARARPVVHRWLRRFDIDPEDFRR